MTISVVNTTTPIVTTGTGPFNLSGTAAAVAAAVAAVQPYVVLPDVVAVAAGTTVIAAQNANLTLQRLTNPALIASYTVTLPAAPLVTVNGVLQGIVELYTLGGVTALTVNATAPATVATFPAAILTAAGSSARFFYNYSTGQWVQG